ncbi:hypothetical protein F5Y14DRAFT_411272 [Nemania sp. NC0429]|nr:hypothetical protein F5Y14DRAFT_411272 [Nemania sp. NC0429]
MEKGEPPSPTPSNTLHQSDDVLHSGFQQLIQHNATASTSYSHPEHHAVDIGSHMESNPHSRYSSPGPRTNMMNSYDHHTPIHHQSPYTAPSYTTGGYHQTYNLDPSPYPQLPDMGSSTVGHHPTIKPEPLSPRVTDNTNNKTLAQNSHNAYSTPATSPPTPVLIEGMTTRSGRAIMRPSTGTTLTRSARVEKAPSKARPKKRKRPIGDAFGEPSSIALSNPLSVLVKDLTNITDTDIQAYVNRSPEERRLEVAQSKTGKVKRPMNAFMLYRKAYQNRTKEWKRLDDIRRKELSASEGKPEKGHDNHQVISQVCGLSWGMEPQELRDQYDEWAKIERNNHRLAFPDYKFAPAKSKVKKPNPGGGGGGSGGSRHGDRESDDDNASNLDAYDINEWHPSSSGPPSRNASRAARYMDPDADYAPPGYTHSVYTTPSPGSQPARLPAGYTLQAPMYPMAHPSPYQYSNPGKPRPADYGSALAAQGQQYYHQQGAAEFAYPHHYGGVPSYAYHHQQGGMPTMAEAVYMTKTSSPVPSFHGSPVLDRHSYGELMPSSSSTAYAPQISHPHHPAILHPQAQAHHFPRHHVEHQIDPSLMGTRHAAPGGGAGNSATATHDAVSYDALGILGIGQGADFASDPLHTFQLDHGVGGHVGSPPQQFEQAYHSLGGNDATTTATTPGAEVGGAGDAASQGAADKTIPTTDWETTLSGASEFQLDDIDQLLGTTTDSPGG